MPELQSDIIAVALGKANFLSTMFEIQRDVYKDNCQITTTMCGALDSIINALTELSKDTE